MMNSANKTNPKVLAYLQLLRLPNVFTAVADVAMGFLFVGGALPRQLPELIVVILSSSCLYLAGMVLNDVFDFEIDSQERPSRPLPSGRISRNTATILGITLLTLGIAAGWSAALFAPSMELSSARTGVIATILAVMVVMYDGVVKKTFLAPIAMGSCRLLNVLLGMSIAPDLTSLFGFREDQWLVAGGMGIYIAGVTWFARNEAKNSSRSNLISATAVMLLGIVLLGLFPLAPNAVPTRFSHAVIWPLLLAVLTFPVFKRCLKAIQQPTPVRVQAAVKQAILTLIVLNAAICLAVAGTLYAILVLSLLLPTLVLGRWVYST